jgi:hypothetical protein
MSLKTFCGVVIAAGVAITVGCAPTSPEVGSGADEVKVASTLWEHAASCDANITRHAGVRQQERALGSIRWICGDRDDLKVEDSSPNGNLQTAGQEYCEYAAYSNGKRVDKLSDAVKGKPLTCMFTSIYQDASTDDAKLAKALASPENLGAPVAKSVVRMKASFNSRSAAAGLISDAADFLKTTPADDVKRHLRTAACFVAAKTKDHGKLQAACDVKNLADDAAWKKAEAAGAKVLVPADGEAFELQQDIVACMTVATAGGDEWRQSDPHIYQVASRAMGECGCSYPDPEGGLAGLDGFSMGTWSSLEQLPAGCRRAVVDGKPSEQLTLCEVPAQEIGDLEFDEDKSNDLQRFCNARFGKDIILTAPLRALEAPGSCKANGAFCSEFAKGAKK